MTSGGGEWTKLAPAGQVFVCAACGKRARSRCGVDEKGASTEIDHGWDESCALHAWLCYEEKRDGQWVAVEP